MKKSNITEKLIPLNPSATLFSFIVTLVVIFSQYFFPGLILCYVVGIALGGVGLTIGSFQSMTRSKPNWKDTLYLMVYNFTLLYWVGFLIGLIATLFQQF